jgi:hypothetical protein
LRSFSSAASNGRISVPTFCGGWQTTVANQRIANRRPGCVSQIRPILDLITLACDAANSVESTRTIGAASPSETHLWPAGATTATFTENVTIARRQVVGFGLAKPL